MYYVYVLDPSGNPLMPTTRYGKVRRMLKSGQAVAARTKPFTIRLAYEPVTVVMQDITAGKDPGRTNIGLAAVREDGVCLYSAKCETRSIEHDHHIIPRSKGGSNTLVNIAGLCESCHTKVHNDEDAAAKLVKTKAGQNKKYHALSVLNQIMPQFLKELDARFPGQVFATTGRDTKTYRDDHGIAKDHDADAYCIACSTLEKQAILDVPKDGFRIKQFRRHDRQRIKSQTERTYKLDGREVARNRRKRMDQKEASLHDWFHEMEKQHGRQAARQTQSRLTVVKSIRRYNNLSRLLPGFQVLYRGKVLTITGQRTNGRYYLSPQEPGVNVPARDVKILKQNTGLVCV